MIFSSKLIENAVNEFSKLPGIGKKTALRLVLHLLKQEPEQVQNFGSTIVKMRQDIVFCNQCHNVSDATVCGICSSSTRNKSLVCIVESIRDIMAIENTAQYNGLYHVLGGIISPIDGIGPDSLTIEPLINRIEQCPEIQEIIMALSPTIEGDTTIFYITKKLKNVRNINITTIARGISFGGELEYADELTLARAIATRLPYENYIGNL